MEEKPFRSGFAALLGRPNAGKSTLMNYFLHQKIAAVSPRPQTTRRRQLGILTTSEMQIIFMDTPGVHQPLNRLGEFMNEEALSTLEDADLLLWLMDLSQQPHAEDHLLAEKMNLVPDLPPVILVMNKIDQVAPHVLQERVAAYQQLMPQAESVRISALSGEGVDTLLEACLKYLPNGPLYYDPEQVTDLYEREIAIDLIREAALVRLRDEVPHEMAIRLDSYEDRGESAAYIAATLFVNRESHKGIVIGKGGSMLKTIGSNARQEIEKLTGRKVYLELRVKVSKNWRDDPEMLRRLGYIRTRSGE
jgi:GTP-binding protein Era